MGLVLDTCVLIHAERSGTLDFSPWVDYIGSRTRGWL